MIQRKTDDAQFFCVIGIIFHIFEKSHNIMETNTFIIILSSLNMTFIWMHELDACHQKEWRMLTFLGKLKEETQYQIFLLAHIPLLLFSIYYLYSVFQGDSFLLWVIWNILPMHI